MRFPGRWRWHLGVLASCLGFVVACNSRTRNEPSLEEKCELLALFCDNVPAQRDDLRECHRIGRAGVRDARQVDRCFPAYDQCIEECALLGSSEEPGPSQPSDAGPKEAGVDDAGD